MGIERKTKDLNSFGANVSLKLPNGEVLEVCLQPYDTMSKLYDIAATKLGVKCDLIRIKYTGKILQKTQSARHLGILSGMVLKSEVITEKVVKITAKFDDKLGMEPATFTVMNTNSEEHIRRNIDDLLPKEPYEIHFHGKKIPRSLPLIDMKFPDSAEVEVIARPTAKKGTAATAASSEQEEGKNTELNEALAFSADGKPVEVVFSFDTTGSMYSILMDVRQSLKKLVERLIQDIPGIRIGLVAHGDYCDESNAIRTMDLCSDCQQLSDFAMNAPSTGGGDAPECYELVLRTAQQMDWSENSAKALVVIGDDVPHPPSMTDQHIYWHTELDVLCGMGIKVYGVHAGNKSVSQKFYKELADRSNGAYIKFSNFKLIQEMFLAVCYNEAGEQQLEQYMEELESTSGERQEQRDILFDNLKEQQMAMKTDKAAELAERRIAFDPKQSANYVASKWFDAALDDLQPKPTYRLDQESNTYKPYVDRSKSDFYERTTPEFFVKPKPSKKSSFLLKCFGK